jgi:hypothetical protein
MRRCLSDYSRLPGPMPPYGLKPSGSCLLEASKQIVENLLYIKIIKIKIRSFILMASIWDVQTRSSLWTPISKRQLDICMKIGSIFLEREVTNRLRINNNRCEEPARVWYATFLAPTDTAVGRRHPSILITDQDNGWTFSITIRWNSLARNPRSEL